MGIGLAGLLNAGLACGSALDVETPVGSTTAEDSTGADSTKGVTATGMSPTPDPASTSGGPEPGMTTGSDGDSTSTCGFLSCDPDTDDVPDECDFWEQNCPEGEKCMPWANDGGPAWNATRCTPLARDPDGPGEPCTVEGSGVSGIDSCELGAMCWNVDAETLAGTCVSLCTGSPNNPSCVSDSEECNIGGDGSLALCLPTCNPLDDAPCPEGEGCYPNNDGFSCLPDASGPKAGGAFDPCESIGACDPGLFCANPDVVGACEPGSPGCCTPFCDLTGPICPDTTMCIPAFPKGSAPPGYEDLGLCGVEAL